MKSKIFAIMLAVMMVVSILPTGVFADDATGTIYVNGVAKTGTLKEIIEDAPANAEVVIDGVITYDGDNTEEGDVWKGSISIEDSITIKGSSNGGKIITKQICLFWVESGTLTLGESLKIETDTLVLFNDGGNTIIDGTNLRIDAVKNNKIGFICYEGKIDIIDCEINYTSSGQPLFYGKGGNVNINVKGGKITASNTAGSVIWIQNGGKSEITGGIITAESGNKAAVVASTGNSDVTISGSAVINGYWIDATDTSEMNINGGQINAMVYAYGGKITINGGHIIKNVLVARGGDVDIKGGAFDTDVTEFLVPGVKQILISDLGKATKRGHDFIGWSIDDGKTILAPDQYAVTTPVAVFEANELGNTEILPRLYPLTVIAGEGGTIEGFEGEKDLVIAFGAGRKIDIVPDEYHVVKNVVVNGKYNLGAVESYEIVSAHMAYSVEVEFEDKIVTEKTAVYTEDFSGETKWVSGGTAEAVVAGEGTISVKSTGGDPNINMPEALNIACEDIDEIVVKYTNNTENTSFQIFFTNEANPGYSEAGSFKGTCAAGENEMVIKTEGNELWTGTLSNMRIDLSNGEGEFIVDEITFNTVETMTAREAAELAAAEAETVAAE